MSTAYAAPFPEVTLTPSHWPPLSTETVTVVDPLSARLARAEERIARLEERIAALEGALVAKTARPRRRKQP